MSQQAEKAPVIAGDRSHPLGGASSHPDATTASTRVEAPAPPRRRFTAHVAWTLLARLVMVANSLAASIIVARRLGAGGLGALAVLNATVAIALQLGSAGLPSANVYFIARDRKLLGPAWANALIFALVGGVTLVLCIIGLAQLRPSLFGHVPLGLVIVASASIPFQLVTLLGLNIFLGLGRIASFNLLDTAAQSVTLVNAVTALVILGAGLPTLVSLNTGAGILLSLLIASLIGLAIRRQSDGQSLRPSAQLFKRMSRYSIKFHISVVAGMLIFRSDLLIVNHFRGEMEAGVYAVASQAAMMLMLLPGVIGTLLMPRAASEPDVRGGFTMRATRHTAFVMLIICLAAAPASLLIPLVYGAPFADAAVQLLILLPGIYLIGLESVLVQHFNSMGLPAAIPLFWVVTLITNVLLNLAFVPWFGARAAAAVSTLSYGMIFILVASYFRVRTGNRLSAALVLRKGELRDLFGTVRLGTSSR